MNDLKPGNPLRVKCRTCGASPTVPCIASPGKNTPRGGVHGKRMRDAQQDRRVNGPPLIVGTNPGNQTERRMRGQLRADAWKRARRSLTPGIAAKLGDLPAVERAVSDASREAKDIQTPDFWRSVWDDEP